MEVLVKYVCGGCGYFWSRRFSVPVEVAASLPITMRIEVPASVSPCCKR